MRPAKTLMVLLSGWLLVALALGIWRFRLDGAMINTWNDVFRIATVVLLVVLLLDLLLKRRVFDVTADRQLPGSLAIHAGNKIVLTVRNKNRWKCRVTVDDHIPPYTESSKLPVTFFIDGGESVTIKYKLFPMRRGEGHFGDIELRISSLLGFWEFSKRCPAAEMIRIYPNFSNIVNFNSIGEGGPSNRFGIHIMRRRGEGLDFNQLREFRIGDSLRQVDWRATSRMLKPISREYQDERDQNVFFLLDCGRRMHAKDGELSHFDHTLNAFLLTGYVALMQGDAVGVLSFAGPHRYVSPLKGRANLSNLLNHLYDLHSTTRTSDYLKAAKDFVNLHRKRSLVILVTNVREEDEEDLKAAIDLLKKYHLVMIANLREELIDKTLQQPVRSFDQALLYSSTVGWQQKRKKSLERLRRQSVMIVDSLPRMMPVTLTNHYLLLKRSGAF